MSENVCGPGIELRTLVLAANAFATNFVVRATAVCCTVSDNKLDVVAKKLSDGFVHNSLVGRTLAAKAKILVRIPVRTLFYSV